MFLRAMPLEFTYFGAQLLHNEWNKILPGDPPKDVETQKQITCGEQEKGCIASVTAFPAAKESAGPGRFGALAVN